MRKDVLNFKKITDRAGFVLVDGIIAVLIVAIGLSALAFMYTQGTKTRVSAERRQAAVQLAGQGMEKLKKADGKTLSALQDIINDINDDGPVALEGLGEYTATSSIVQEDESGTHKLETVRITVSWDDPQAVEMVIDSYILVSK